MGVGDEVPWLTWQGSGDTLTRGTHGLQMLPLTVLAKFAHHRDAWLGITQTVRLRHGALLVPSASCELLAANPKVSWASGDEMNQAIRELPYHSGRDMGFIVDDDFSRLTRSGVQFNFADAGGEYPPTMGMRHRAAESIAFLAPGHPVCCVSEERRTVTLFMKPTWAGPGIRPHRQEIPDQDRCAALITSVLGNWDRSVDNLRRTAAVVAAVAAGEPVGDALFVLLGQGILTRRCFDSLQHLFVIGGAAFDLQRVVFQDTFENLADDIDRATRQWLPENLDFVLDLLGLSPDDLRNVEIVRDTMERGPALARPGHSERQISLVGR